MAWWMCAYRYRSLEKSNLTKIVSMRFWEQTYPKKKWKRFLQDWNSCWKRKVMAQRFWRFRLSDRIWKGLRISRKKWRVSMDMIRFRWRCQAERRRRENCRLSCVSNRRPEILQNTAVSHRECVILSKVRKCSTNFCLTGTMCSEMPLRLPIRSEKTSPLWGRYR